MHCKVMRWRDTRAHRPAICTRNRCTHYVQSVSNRSWPKPQLLVSIECLILMLCLAADHVPNLRPLDTELLTTSSCPAWSVTTTYSVKDIKWDDNHKMLWVVPGCQQSDTFHQYSMDGYRINEKAFSVVNKLCRIYLENHTGRLIASDGHMIMRLVKETGKRETAIKVPGCGLLSDIVYCKENNLYIAGDTRHHCLWFVHGDEANSLTSITSDNQGNRLLISPQYLCHQHHTDGTCLVYACDYIQNTIFVFNSKGVHVRTFGSAAELSHPCGLCIDYI